MVPALRIGQWAEEGPGQSLGGWPGGCHGSGPFPESLPPPGPHALQPESASQAGTRAQHRGAHTDNFTLSVSPSVRGGRLQAAGLPFGAGAFSVAQ